MTNNHIYADVSFQDNIKDSAKIIENIMKQLSLENQKKLTEDLLHLLGFKNITKDNDNQLSASYSKTLYKNLTFAYFSDIWKAKCTNADGILTIKKLYDFSFYYFDSQSNQETTLISITEQTLKIYLGESESAGYKLDN